MTKRSLQTAMAFIIGLPLGLGLLAIMAYTPLAQTALAEYVSNPVEQVTVIMFGCAVGGLLAKLAGCRSDLAAFAREWLPAWDGKAVPVEAAARLLDELEPHAARLESTMLGRRILDTLEFVRSRRCANDLDDHLHTLADNDEVAVDGSYSLVRFISWAIPILGFLGTVLGITKAVANVSPDMLEKNLDKVTDGLATAFNATALALGLTMVVMFLMSLVERLEQAVLARVNEYAEEQLGHRFERTGPESNEFVEVVRRNSQVLIEATDKLVQRQAALWSQSMQEARRTWAETGQAQQQQVTEALEQALERTLATHAQRLAEQEHHSQRAAALVVDKLQQLSVAVASSAQQQHNALTQMLQKVVAQTEVLARLADNTTQLAQMQQVLRQNLEVLASAGSFDQAVSSLTAAIHLLTARAGMPSRSAGSLLNRPGEAA